jgi:O-antigen ligase
MVGGTNRLIFNKATQAGCWQGVCRFSNPHLLLLGIDQSTSILVLLAGLVFSQTIEIITKWPEFETFSFRRKTLIFFTLFFVATCFMQSDIPHAYKYHAQNRWTGLWVNPNTYGLLMGLGIVTAIGLIIFYIKFCVSDSREGWSCRLKAGMLVPLTVLMSVGLMHSYSRGAWLATSCGMAYLIWFWQYERMAGSEKWETEKLKLKSSCALSWLKRNQLPFAFILASIFMLAFWHFWQTNWHPAQRVLSVVNPVDYSWRNRVAAWDGALQITAEHPWFGAGWNQPEQLYEQYYLPSRLSESGAIEMNDYLMFSATLGIPALFCFGMYLWLSMMRKSEARSRDLESRIQNPELEKTDWLKAVCRAGVIILLIGFWFDGGLFKLSTAATFWILLELGAAQSHHEVEKSLQ